MRRGLAPAILLLCLALRAAALDRMPVFIDEAIHVSQAQEALAQGAWLRPGIARYLPTWINALVVARADDPLRALRLVSAVCGTLTAAGLIVLGRRLGQPAAGLLAALLYAIVPYGVVHDRMGLVDPLFTTLVAWSGVAAAGWRERPTARRGAALGLLIAGLLLTKPYGVLGLAVPVLFAPRRREGGTAWTALGLVFAVAALAAAPLWLDLQGVLPMIAEGQGASAAEALAQSPARLAEAARWHLAYLTPAGVVLAGLALLRRAVGGRTPWRAVALWVLWGPVVALLLALSSNFSQFPRHLLPSVPLLLYVIASEATARLDTRAGRVAAAAALLAVAVPSLALDHRLVADPRTAPIAEADRWQYVTGWPSGYGLAEVAAYLRAESRGRDLEVVRDERWVPLSLGLDLHLRDAAVRRASLAEPETWADEVPLLLESGRAVFLAREVEGGAPDLPVLDLRGEGLATRTFAFAKPEGARVVELLALTGHASASPTDDAVPADAGRDPSEAVVLARRGVAAALAADPVRAADFLREAYRLDPGEVTIRYDLGVVLAALRRSGAATQGSDATH